MFHLPPDFEHDGNFARGLAIGLAISAAIWMIIIFAFKLVVH